VDARPRLIDRAMLNLAAPTEDTWVEAALGAVDDILLEQAHLEKKAAAAAMRFLFRYPQYPELQAPLSELAREELEHFERVLHQLERRGVGFGPQEAGPYAGRLLTCVRGHEPERMLDSMLCSALIEARSCERMKIFGEALDGRDAELSAMYLDLVASEARHHGLYLRLAEGIFGADRVSARLAEVAAHEAEVIARPPRLARLHG